MSTLGHPWSHHMNSFGRIQRGAIAGALAIVVITPLGAQGGGAVRDTVLVAKRDSLERELQAIAVVDRKLMIPMRDGTRMQFDVYRPKNVAKAPAIFVRTPY